MVDLASDLERLQQSQVGRGVEKTLEGTGGAAGPESCQTVGHPNETSLLSVQSIEAPSGVIDGAANFCLDIEFSMSVKLPS